MICFVFMSSVYWRFYANKKVLITILCSVITNIFDVDCFLVTYVNGKLIINLKDNLKWIKCIRNTCTGKAGRSASRYRYASHAWELLQVFTPTLAQPYRLRTCSHRTCSPIIIHNIVNIIIYMYYKFLLNRLSLLRSRSF